MQVTEEPRITYRVLAVPPTPPPPRGNSNLDPEEHLNQSARYYAAHRHRKRAKKIIVVFDDDSRASWPVPEFDPRTVEQPPVFVFGPGYRTCLYKGTRYQFSEKQSLVVQQLHEAKLAGLDFMQQGELLRGADSESTRLSELFKGHGAWGVLIIHDGRGSYRLIEEESEAWPP
jgi:hypothetical protein